MAVLVGDIAIAAGRMVTRSRAIASDKSTCGSKKWTTSILGRKAHPELPFRTEA
jgi:hypothetical protein